MITTMGRSRLLACTLVVLVGLTPAAPGLAVAQAPPAPPAGAPPPAPPAGAAPAGPSAKAFTAEQLEQLAAPIALHPDPLVAQVLMAATYPLEVVEAARFAKENAKVQGDQLNEALKDKTWDDSVKSLVYFPQVLAMMDQKIDWTQQLGDAFLGQQKDLLNAIQKLRARAQSSGNLKSSSEQKVTVEPAPAAATQPAASSPTVVVQQPAQIIKIEPTNPEVVYVPSYNPTVVYGAWPYPAYPPYYPYPPGYGWGAAAVSFGVGMAVGAAVWGNCNWGGGDVDIDVNRNSNFSKNVNRTNVAAERTQKVQNRQQSGGGKSQWQHNPENRRGAQYRDQATQQKFNKASNPGASQSREAFRGRAEQGRQDLGQGPGGGRDGAGRGEGPGGGPRPSQGGGAGDRAGGAGDRGGAGRGDGPGGGGQNFGSSRDGGPRPSQGGGAGDRGGAGGAGGGFGDRGGGASASQLGGGGGRDAGAFQGMGGSGADVRNQSSRGQSSRQSMGGGGSSGVSRAGAGGGAGGGGAARGGGGGGRGGGGGGRR